MLRKHKVYFSISRGLKFPRETRCFLHCCFNIGLRHIMYNLCARKLDVICLIPPIPLRYALSGVTPQRKNLGLREGNVSAKFAQLKSGGGSHSGLPMSMSSQVTPGPPGRTQSRLKSEDISQGPNQDSASFENGLQAQAKTHTLQGAFQTRTFFP